MEPFHADELVDRQRDGEDLYLEFLRRDSMSVGVYRLPAGATDPQEPHSEDEVYYVLEGEATVRIADETYPVEPGSVVFVERHVDHAFVDIEADLVALVFFAPAEGSLAGG